MPYIFHQNMRVYGGGPTVVGAAGKTREELFSAAFQSIRRSSGTEVTAEGCLVAGFTEVCNATLAPASIECLAEALDRNLQVLVTCWIGQGMKKSEYISIALSSPPLAMGMVLPFSLGGAGPVYNWVTIPGAVQEGVSTYEISPPAYYSTVYVRGLAWVVVKYRGQRYFIGFMHNTYKEGAPTAYFASIPAMVTSALKWYTGEGDMLEKMPVMIGGDFNCLPESIGAAHSKAGEGPISPSQIKGLTSLNPIAPKDVSGNFVPTTAVNPYDFWLTNDLAYPGSGAAAILPQTRRPGLSDHAGIALSMPSFL